MNQIHAGTEELVQKILEITYAHVWLDLWAKTASVSESVLIAYIFLFCLIYPHFIEWVCIRLICGRNYKRQSFKK